MENPERVPRRLNRRDALMIIGGAAFGAAATGYGVGVATASTRAPRPEAAAEEPPAPIRRFLSTDLTAPEITTARLTDASPASGYLFATPRTRINNGVIYDDDGEPVWIEPTGQNVTDLRVQRYQGQPVLTYWAGELVEGYGLGAGIILDSQYRIIATVTTAAGVQADLHEFILTDRGTAYLMAYPIERQDLSAVDGPRDGFILGGRVQEIDIATGQLLFDWDMRDHIDITETYQPLTEARDGASPATAFDPVHLNSIGEDGDALLLSARHTHAIYSIDRFDGRMRWRLGGRRSDFELGPGVEFSWQHDARREGPGVISLFDNHGSSGARNVVSAALLLDLDEEGMTAEVAQRFEYDDHFGFAQGNAQVLDGGNVLVGWGSEPAATEFDATGRALFEVTALGEGSYRVYRDAWSARPATVPDVAVSPADGGRVTVHASWNGATDVASWRVLGGADAAAATPSATVARSGFETAIETTSAAVTVVEALAADGTVLGRSAPVSSAG